MDTQKYITSPWRLTNEFDDNDKLFYILAQPLFFCDK